ncbi:MAG: hypothetical protein ACE5FU_09810 [Nitrospinota bacterium]
MGKTKTAFVEGATEKPLSGKDKYKLKQQKRKEKEAAETKKKVRVAGLGGGQRVVAVSADLPGVENPEEEHPSPGSDTKKLKPKTRGKKYQQSRSQLDRAKLYKLSEAIELVKKTSYSRFDGTAELHATLKSAKSGLNETVQLPHSTGKAKKIEIADEKTIKKLGKGKVDFDVLLSTPEMMAKLVPFAKILGPKGLMPNPKNGTLIKTKADAKKFPADKVTIKTERKAPLIHVSVGKVSQKPSELVENIKKVISAIGRNKIKKAHLCATMGPSVKLDL